MPLSFADRLVVSAAVQLAFEGLGSEFAIL